MTKSRQNDQNNGQKRPNHEEAKRPNKWTLKKNKKTKGTGSYEPLLSLIKPVEVLVQSPKKAACEASMGYASEELLSIFLAPFGMFPKLCKFGFSGASCQKSHVKFPDVVMWNGKRRIPLRALYYVMLWQASGKRLNSLWACQLFLTH